VPARALARVNLAAIERNVARLGSGLAEGCKLCAVVKADGYGHGAVPAGRVALAGGASWLAVATAGEAVELRDAGIDSPILIMGAISSEELPWALAARAELVAWSEEFVEEVARTDHNQTPLHVKLDTGMGRLGTRDPGRGLELAERVAAAGPAVRLSGAMTHFATADDDIEFLGEQLRAFTPFAEQMRRRYPDLVVHAANSAATLRSQETHFDLVRCGIAVYGCDPANADPSAVGLDPALELTSYVAAVKRAEPGDSVGYGRRFIADRPTWIATAPIGYADGIRRGFTNNLEALVGGRRHPLVGAVSMDNITLDLGAELDAQVGDTVTIIGTDGGERQTAEELAQRIDTINYEIVCGISKRVPRHYHRDGAPVG
jgi:alanine racemase